MNSHVFEWIIMYVVLEWLLSALMREEGVRNLLTKRTGKEGEQRRDL